MRYQNVSEAFIELEAAPTVANKICTQSIDLCLSIIDRDNGRQLNFENGCAIITVADDGLIVRVSAGELLTFYGIQTLIEGRLWEIAPGAARSMTWLPAREPRFGQFPRTATTHMRE
ncbi:SMa0974 family conjugal transfer regulator [Rhizobium sp. GR12]|uniref:SMa0974 family conjugal transfer regulator n=1 Tax=Rhizobium sp. GR12 TaxID=3053925 RepID=UPI003FA6E399